MFKFIFLVLSLIKTLKTSKSHFVFYTVIFSLFLKITHQKCCECFKKLEIENDIKTVNQTHSKDSLICFIFHRKYHFFHLSFYFWGVWLRFISIKKIFSQSLIKNKENIF